MGMTDGEINRGLRLCQMNVSDLCGHKHCRREADELTDYLKTCFPADVRMCPSCQYLATRMHEEIDREDEEDEFEEAFGEEEEAFGEEME